MRSSVAVSVVAALVAAGGVTAWAWPGPDEAIPRDTFLGRLSVGDSVSIDGGGPNGYDVAIVTAEALTERSLTAEEAAELARLSGDGRKGTAGMTEADRQRLYALDNKRVAMIKSFEVTAVEADHIGLRGRDGRLRYLPERRINMIGDERGRNP